MSFLLRLHPLFFFFFFNDTATTEIYTLSLHDALPICGKACDGYLRPDNDGSSFILNRPDNAACRDRKSTRLNSSHLVISYAVFCLKKKKKNNSTRVLLQVITYARASPRSRARGDV